jgi:hypothetical protein
MEKNKKSMKKLFFILPVILFISCTSKIETNIEVLGVMSAPGLTMSTKGSSEILEDHIVVIISTIITKRFGLIEDVEFVTFLSPIYNFENIEDYTPGTILKRGYVNDKQGLFPEWKIKE